MGPYHNIETVRCPVIWCHGNHEDFVELRKTIGSGALEPVDAFGRIMFLRSGRVVEVAGIRIAAVGGGVEIENSDNDDDPSAYAKENACEKLIDTSDEGTQAFDVLITHVSPEGISRQNTLRGSKLLRIVDEMCQPSYHFYAHHKNLIAADVADTIGNTQCFWLNDVTFKKQDQGMFPFGPLEQECMGILSWNSPTEHHFEVLHESWQSKITWSNWHYV